MGIASIATLACRSAGPGARAEYRPAPVTEVSAVQDRDAYEFIARVRPGFLHRRRDPHAPTMVVDERAVLGDIEVLHGFPLQGVTRISYLNAAECEQRFGSSYRMQNGAILIEHF